jgi:hypothetical protein
VCEEVLGACMGCASGLKGVIWDYVRGFNVSQ